LEEEELMDSPLLALSSCSRGMTAEDAMGRGFPAGALPLTPACTVVWPASCTGSARAGTGGFPDAVLLLGLATVMPAAASRLEDRGLAVDPGENTGEGEQ
jgi:hypothetical protein